MRYIKQNVVFAKKFDVDLNLIKQVVVTNRNPLSSIDLVRRDVDLMDLGWIKGAWLMTLWHDIIGVHLGG